MKIINTILFSYLFLLNIRLTLSDVYVYNYSNKLMDSFDDQRASFGPAFPSSGSKGYLTVTNPANACTTVSPPPFLPRAEYRWIALIPRTKGLDACEFALKVQNAQNANFSAVIIYNYEDALFPMGSSAKNVRIPATLITHTGGLTLISHYLYNRSTVNATPVYHVEIEPEAPFNFGIYMIPFVAVLALVLLTLVGFILVRCHLQRRRMQRHRLPRSALKQLKIKKFAKTDPWEVCVICLDDFEEGVKLRILPCNHAYHMKCIDPWLINNRRQCPVCKRYVFPNLDHSDDEENTGHQQPRTPTEQTPLVHSNDDDNDDSTTEIPRNRPLLERRFYSRSNNGTANISYVSNDSSDSIEDLSSSPRPTTTAEIAFNRAPSNSRRYGSLHDSLRTPRIDNFSVGIFGNTNDSTNRFARSNLEDVSDIETVDEDDDENEQMHSVVSTTSETNPAYINDKESSSDAFHTHL